MKMDKELKGIMIAAGVVGVILALMGAWVGVVIVALCMIHAYGSEWLKERAFRKEQIVSAFVSGDYWQPCQRVEAVGSAHGLTYVVKFSGRWGHRCGYVEIPNIADDEAREEFHCSLEGRTLVHGGITFFDKVGEKWYAGFDCGHGGDAPDVKTLWTEFEHKAEPTDGHVWTHAEAVSECKKLANEIRRLSKTK